MAVRGKLTIYLGYAAGVGKTYKMLSDAQQLQRQGTDVVIGYFEPHARPDTMRVAEGLSMVPRREAEYRGARVSDMDTEAVMARNPAVCVVDELAHSNVPGSARSKRWQDVERLRDHGISVLTTLNVQHIESLNDQIEQISGIRVRETVPDWVVAQAHDVVVVDVTPRALMHRLERGAVYSPAQAERALARFFRESTLGALRELALRQAALVTGARQAPTAPSAGSSGERVLVIISADPATAMVLRRARRVADHNQAPCLAVMVSEPGPEPDAVAREAVERHLEFARNLRIDPRTVDGPDAAAAVVEFARQQRITQIFVPRGPMAPRLVRLARDMQVTVVARRRSGQ